MSQEQTPEEQEMTPESMETVEESLQEDATLEAEVNELEAAGLEEAELQDAELEEAQDAYASEDHEAVEISKPEPLEPEKLQRVIEGALLASGQPLNAAKVLTLFEKSEAPSKEEIQEAFEAIAANCEGRGFELKEVATGWRFQVREETATWVNRLFDEKPQKYSRALLETLALIAYRQPITRGDIEEIRGVAVSSHIIKTLSEREWIKVVGHRDVPGRPSLYATTRQFLDYFNLKSLEELPSLGEISDLENLNPELELEEMPPVPQTPDLPVDVDEQEDSAELEQQEADVAESAEDTAESEEALSEDTESETEIDLEENLVEPSESAPDVEDEALEAAIASGSDEDAEPALEEQEAVVEDEPEAVAEEKPAPEPVEDPGITYQASEGSKVSSLFDSSPEEEV